MDYLLGNRYTTESRHRAGRNRPTFQNFAIGVRRIMECHSAKTLLLALPDQSAILLAARRAKQLNPAVKTIARSSGRDRSINLSEAGVDSIIQPEFEGGVEMVRQVLVQYGDEADATQLTADIRREFYRQLGEGGDG